MIQYRSCLRGVGRFGRARRFHPQVATGVNPSSSLLSQDEQIQEIVRGVAEVLPSREALAERLAPGRPLRVKLGVDPTNFDLHLGHTVPLRKLRGLQRLGHHIQFLIGGFTARIGDPTGRSEARPQLSREQVDAFAGKFLEQVFTILDREKTEVLNNADWFERMMFADVVRLASQATVARMLERDYFQDRMQKNLPIHLHEFLYPLMQGHDSVEMKSDIEIGGTDQKFNILMGRQLQESAGQPPQIVLLLPLLPGTDGTQKMSKTTGNHIPVDDPPLEMYSKVLSVPDGVMVLYFELLTDVPVGEVKRIRTVLDWWTGGEKSRLPLETLGEADRGLYSADPGAFTTIASPWHPKNLKKRLGREIVATRHSVEAAVAAEAEWVRIHEPQGEGLPADMPEVDLRGRYSAGQEAKAIDLAEACGLAASRAELKRLAKQGGLRVNGAAIADHAATVRIEDGMVLSAGRRTFVKVRV